jgi:hypothetical protein
MVSTVRQYILIYLILILYTLTLKNRDPYTYVELCQINTILVNDCDTDIQDTESDAYILRKPHKMNITV